MSTQIVTLHEPEPTTLPVITGKENRTEGGNGRRLVAVYSQDIRYCNARKCWYVWNGQRWVPDENSYYVAKNMKVTIHKYREECEQILGDEALQQQVGRIRDKFNDDGDLRTGETLTKAEEELLEKMANAEADLEYLIRSDNRDRVSGSIFMAQGEDDIAADPRDFDTNPYLFNCQNGTIDLRTGKRRPHRREDFITRLAPVTYDPLAFCPEFDETLRLMYEDRSDGEEYLILMQDFLGLSLTGLVPKDVVLMLGAGSNGKSTLVQSVAGVMGSVNHGGYAYAVPASTFMLSQWGDEGGRPRSDLRKMEGARLIHTAEMTKRFTLNMALLKILTGGESISARDLHERQTEFEPQGKIIILTNEMPILSEDTEGVWNRLRKVDSDANLPDKLRAEGREPQDEFFKILVREEGSGILNWLLQGCRRCLKRQAEGKPLLVMPQGVAASTKEFQREVSRIANFVNERCVLKAGLLLERTALYNEYKTWCQAQGFDPENQKRFAEIFVRDFPTLAPPDGKPITDRTTRRALWKGIGLRTSEEVAGF